MISSETTPLRASSWHDRVHRVEIERQVAPRNLDKPVLVNQSRLLNGRVRLIRCVLIRPLVVLVAWILLVTFIIILITLIFLSFGFFNHTGVFGLGSSAEPTPRFGLRAGAPPCAACRPCP